MLTIHVGLHKTGSTAIQQHLSSRASSSARRLAFLGTDNLLGGNGFQVPRDSKQGHSRVLNVLAKHQNVVISHEAFLGKGWSMYSEARQNALAMLNHFAQHTDFRVVIYLRPQYQWFESVYTHFVQKGNYEEPAEFVGRLAKAKYAYFSRLVDDLIETLDSHRLVVRAYTEGLDVVADFYSLFDLPADFSPNNLPRANVSVNPAQVDLLRRLNESAKDSPDRGQLRWFFQDFCAGEQSRRFSVLPEQLQEQLIALTLADWQILTGSIQGTRFSNPKVFQEVVEDAAIATVRPYIGAPANREEIIREASRSIEVAVPLVWSQTNQLKPRVARVLGRVRNKAAVDPVNLLPAATRSILNRVNLPRKQH